MTFQANQVYLEYC